MEKQSIKAEIILDSIERIGNNRATTWKLTYPRFIHAELLTHAILKSNSASSRAIPFKRMVKTVQEDPFIPIAWQKEHSGMQGFEYYDKNEQFSLAELYDIMIQRLKKIYETEEDDNVDVIEMYQVIIEEFPLGAKYTLDEFWLKIRDKVVVAAMLLACLGVTKQICNRLLEPFLWHTIILTGTEFENFFALRAHPMAEIHLQDLAYKMLDGYNASTPQELKEGEWHIPHLELIDEGKLHEVLFRNNIGKPYETLTDYKVRISTAISAQISYLKFGSDDYVDLIDLHDSLVIRPYSGKRGIRELTDPIHASPASHCLQAMTEDEYLFESDIKYKGTNEEREVGWCHSFRGFKSYRSMLPNENSTDSRVIKK